MLDVDAARSEEVLRGAETASLRDRDTHAGAEICTGARDIRFGVEIGADGDADAAGGNPTLGGNLHRTGAVLVDKDAVQTAGVDIP